MLGFDIKKQTFTIKSKGESHNDTIIERDGEVLPTKEEFTVGKLKEAISGAENNLRQMLDFVEKTEEEIKTARKKLKMVKEIEKLPKADITAIGAFINRLHMIEATGAQIEELKSAIADNKEFIDKIESDTGIKIFE